MALKHKREITILKALADDNRLEVMKLLQGGEKCACQLIEALEIGQPTLSHHMRILCEAGLVDACKDGKWMHYSLSAEGSAEVRAIIAEYTLSPDKVNAYKKCDCKQK